jgi:hypothetical protein
MTIKSESKSRSFARSIAMGVLISMLFFYSIHLFGKWQIENYRPDIETTSSLLLHNTCLIFNVTHTLRPNTDVSNIDKGINGTKLGGSFMNFFDGHIFAMVILAFLLGGFIFMLRSMIKKKQQEKPIQ